MQSILISDEVCSLALTKAAWESSERRRGYLLRSDVEVPISADPRVTTRVAVPDANSCRIVVTAESADQDDLTLDALVAAGGFSRDVDPGYLVGAELLGFDVCDRDLYSALSNCGYVDDDERTRARERWASRLTQDHLVSELEDAKAAKRVADARVPEHAPFFVMRVHRVD